MPPKKKLNAKRCAKEAEDMALLDQLEAAANSVNNESAAKEDLHRLHAAALYDHLKEVDTSLKIPHPGSSTVAGLNIEGRLAEVQRLKEIGNSYFSQWRACKVQRVEHPEEMYTLSQQALRERYLFSAVRMWNRAVSVATSEDEFISSWCRSTIIDVSALTRAECEMVATIFSNLSMALLEKAEFGAALQAAEAATRLFPTWHKGPCRQARALQSWGKYPRALRILDLAKQSVSSDIARSEIDTLITEIRKEQARSNEQLEGQESDFSCAICFNDSLDPCQIPKCRHILCRLCTQRVILEPNSLCPLCRHPLANEAIGPLPKAIRKQYYLGRVERNPADAVAWYNLACSIYPMQSANSFKLPVMRFHNDNVMVKDEAPRSAVDCLKEAIHQKSQFPEAWAKMGECLGITCQLSISFSSAEIRDGPFSALDCIEHSLNLDAAPRSLPVWSMAVEAMMTAQGTPSAKPFINVRGKRLSFGDLATKSIAFTHKRENEKSVVERWAQVARGLSRNEKFTFQGDSNWFAGSIISQIAVDDPCWNSDASASVWADLAIAWRRLTPGVQTALEKRRSPKRFSGPPPSLLRAIMSSSQCTFTPSCLRMRHASFKPAVIIIISVVSTSRKETSSSNEF